MGWTGWSVEPQYRPASSALVGRASIVMHGLGVELWSGRLSAPDDADLVRLVEQFALPVVAAARDAGWISDLHSRPVTHTGSHES